MRRQLFVMLSILVLLSMVLGACGGGEAPAPVPPTEAPAQAAPTTAPEPTPVPEATTAPAPTEAPPAPEAKPGLSADSPLNMLFVPSGQAEKILAGGSELDKLLAEKGIYTKSTVATSYAAAVEAICSGQADIAWLAPLSYVLANDKCDAEVLLNAVRFGSPTYNGQIMVRKDSGIKSVADLKGKKFAFTDPASTSGYLYPSALMLKSGVDPAKDLTEAVFAGSHNAAAIAVYQGSVDGAATFVDVRTQLEEQFPDVMEVTEVIALTDPIPNDTISVSPALDAETADKFKQAMLELMATDEGKKVAYDIYEWDGIAESSDQLFDPVRQAATALGIALQNWKGVSVKYKIGLVTDVGGVNDKSFNQSAWKGVQDAMSRLEVEGQFIESKQVEDYEKNIDAFATEGYDMIVTVGFLMGDATAKKALEYPDIKFAIVDYAYFPANAGDPDPYIELKNVASLMFQEDEVGYLAGVLAACMSKTGVIGSVAGMEIPPVVRFVTGYQNGAKSVNPDVKTLNQYIPSFTDPAKGKEVGLSMLAQGADVLFGVGGNTGNGGLVAAKEKGGMGIGVDVDQYETYPEVKDILITSAAKNVDVAVYNAIRSMTRGALRPGISTFNVSNEGIGLAPYHDWEDKIPQDCKDKVMAATEGLKSGEVKTGYQP